MQAAGPETDRLSLLYRLDKAVQTRIMREQMSFYDEVKVKIRCGDYSPWTVYTSLTDAWRGFHGCKNYSSVNKLTLEEVEMITVHLTFPDRLESEVYRSIE